MAIPKFQDFLYPFMLNLMNHDSNKADMKTELSKYFNLSDEDRKLKTRGGSGFQLTDRIGWCLQWLRRAKFVDIPQRGVWRISQRGKEYMSTHIDLKESDLLEFPEFADYSGRSKPHNKSITKKDSPNQINNLFMKQNDNWLEIVELVKPVIDSKLPYLSYYNTVVMSFRLLGWKKTKGTIVTFSSNNSDIKESLIFLNIEKEDLHIPIVPLDINGSYTEESRVSMLFKAMKDIECSIGILFSETIQIYYQDTKEKGDPICIVNIAFDNQDEYGHTLCNFLSFQTFSFKNFEKFCAEEYSKLPTGQNLHNRLLNITQDSLLITQLLKNHLISEGFEESLVEDELEKYSYIIKVKEGYQNDETNLEKQIKGTRDNTRFSIDGGQTYYKKRNFVLMVIRQYIKDHPDVTLDDLEIKFPSKIISRIRGVVRPLSIVQEWVNEDPSIANRFFMAPDDIITLKDGMQIVVHNQWGNHFPKFLAIAQSLYTVTSNQPYFGLEPDRNVASEQNHDIKQEGKIGIRISADSFSKFQKKK